MLNFFILIVIVSVFAMDSFHSSPGEAGLASGIFVISSFIARLLCGKWMERIGRKKTLYWGMIAGLAMSLLYFGTTSILFLLVVRFLHGASFGVASTVLMTVVSDIIPKERRGEGIGFSALSSTLASAVGPFLSMFISRHGGFDMVFTVCAVSVASSFVLVLFLTIPEVVLTKEQIRETKGFHLRSFFEPSAVPISAVCSAAYLCYSSVLAFLAPYAREIHLVEAAGFFFVVYSAATVLSRPCAGRLFDSRGADFVMYPAIFLFATGLIVLSKAHHGYALLLAGGCMGLGLGAVQSATQTIAVKEAPPHRLGLANSTFFMSVDIAIGIGPFMLGMFVPFTGYRGLYTGIAGVACASALFYYLLYGRTTATARNENT